MNNTTVNPMPDSMSKTTALCLSCGLCCKGVLHSHAGLEPEEIAFAEDMQLPVVQSYEYAAFSLPCPRFDEDEHRCSIFPNRPQVCENYACDLLKGLREGTLDFDTCMVTVKETKALIDTIYQHLGGRDASKQLWTQVNEFAARQIEDQGLIQREHAPLLLDIKRLALLCGRFEKKSFEPWTRKEARMPG